MTERNANGQNGRTGRTVRADVTRGKERELVSVRHKRHVQETRSTSKTA